MPNRYAEERYNPKAPTCGSAPIRLSFDGQFLRGSGTSYAVAYSAVSGKLINW